MKPKAGTPKSRPSVVHGWPSAGTQEQIQGMAQSILLATEGGATLTQKDLAIVEDALSDIKHNDPDLRPGLPHAVKHLHKQIEQGRYDPQFLHGHKYLTKTDYGWIIYKARSAVVYFDAEGGKDEKAFVDEVAAVIRKAEAMQIPVNMTTVSLKRHLLKQIECNDTDAQLLYSLSAVYETEQGAPVIKFFLKPEDSHLIEKIDGHWKLLNDEEVEQRADNWKVMHFDGDPRMNGLHTSNVNQIRDWIARHKVTFATLESLATTEQTKQLNPGI